MSQKAFLVQVEVEIQAISCPGVWLCSNGKVSLQLYMLDSCIQTASYKPVFPVICNESFLFYKTFYVKHCLSELQRELNKEWIYVEFIQWQSCEIGNVLATFQTTLEELLYPSCNKRSFTGLDIDLLMEPSRLFPGTIAPKIEISTKTTIEEILCNCTNKTSVSFNPKLLTSNPYVSHRTHNRTVCHSMAYSRIKQALRTRKARPPFRFKKAEDDLILRKTEYISDNLDSFTSANYRVRSLDPNSCYHRINIKAKPMKEPYSSEDPAQYCVCNGTHEDVKCPLCLKYNGYFFSGNKNRQPITCDFYKKNNKQLSKYKNYNKFHCGKIHKSKSDESLINSIQEEAINEKRSLTEKIHKKLTKTPKSNPNSKELVHSLCYDVGKNNTNERDTFQKSCSLENILENGRNVENEQSQSANLKCKCKSYCPMHKNCCKC